MEEKIKRKNRTKKIMLLNLIIFALLFVMFLRYNSMASVVHNEISYKNYISEHKVEVLNISEISNLTINNQSSFQSSKAPKKLKFPISMWIIMGIAFFMILENTSDFVKYYIESYSEKKRSNKAKITLLDEEN